MSSMYSACSDAYFYLPTCIVQVCVCRIKMLCTVEVKMFSCRLEHTLHVFRVNKHNYDNEVVGEA